MILYFYVPDNWKAKITIPRRDCQWERLGNIELVQDSFSGVANDWEKNMERISLNVIAPIVYAGIWLILWVDLVLHRTNTAPYQEPMDSKEVGRLEITHLR